MDTEADVAYAARMLREFRANQPSKGEVMSDTQKDERPAPTKIGAPSREEYNALVARVAALEASAHAHRSVLPDSRQSRL
jgi:hypothetical protein